jgi:DNA-binding response OmpR family regulator
MTSVLVIEGDAAVARFLVEVFSEQGWQADAPRTGPQVAAALLSNTHYDLITVSFRFPGTNGVDIVTLIRELEHRKGSPVLMITGDPAVTVKALEAGTTEVLYKPIESHELVTAVMRYTALQIAS